MHDPQRVTALHDVDAGQGPPCSSHCVKRAAAARFKLGEIGKIVPDDALGPLQRFTGGILQCEASERQRHASANPVAAHVRQLQRSAAEIADHTVGSVNPRDHAKRGQFRFARTGQDFDRHSADALRLGDEIRAIGGLATRGGGDCVHAADFHHPA